MAKFKKKENFLEGAPEIKNKYIAFAYELEEFSTKTFENWKKQSKEDVVNFLQWNILSLVPETTPGSPKRYQVHFNFELLKIIKEAKYLDRLGRQSHKVI